MANAFILFNATQTVKQTTGVSDYTFHNKSGFIATLVINGIKYTHTFTQTVGGVNVTAGYYQEIPFLKWLVNKTIATDLTPYVLDMGKLVDAVKGDTVLVETLRIVTPYTDFCKLNQYSWNYNPAIKILDDQGNIIIPPGTQPTIMPVSLVVPALSFYSNSIPLINSPDFTDNKDDAAYSLALCALLIDRINVDVFPLFNSVPGLATYILNQNAYWQTGTIFNQPTYEDILQYEESLANYYNATYSNQYYITAQNDSNKFIWLASVLSPSALAVFPLDTKIALLNQLLDVMSQAKTSAVAAAISPIGNVVNNPFAKIAAIGPALILNLTASVVDVPTQTDSFLNSLLKTKYTNTFSADQTVYEALYDALSDNNIGILTLGAINANNNRKQFVLSVYGIWKSSKYYPYYNSPNYTQPANPSTGVFPEAFFITNKGTYYNNKTASATLNYNSVTTSFATYVVNYQYEFNNLQIKAYKVDTETNNKDNPLANGSQLPTLYGTYHLYQPLSLIGYTQNPVVHLPKTSCIPVFYLLYAYEAKAIQDFDIGIMDFIELGINLGLNLTGAGEITDLSYLSEISELAEVETLADSTPILNWENFLGLNRTVMITAGSVNAITQYLAQEAGNADPDVQAFLKTLNEFLGIIALGTLAIDATAQIISSFKAQQIIEESASLDESDQLPSDVREEIEEFVGNISELVDLMNTKLLELPNIPSGSNTIIGKFAQITDAQEQLNFFNYFYFIDDDDPLWLEYNEIYTANTFSDDGIVIGTTQKTLIDVWATDLYAINNIPAARNDFTVVQSFQFLEKSDQIFKHVFFGDIAIDRPILANGSLGNTSVDLSGMHNPSKITTVPPYIEGQWNFKGNFVENKLGYGKGKIERCMTANDIDPATGERWVNPFETDPARKYMKTKSDPTAIWPSSYSTQRIRAEMAVSFANKVQKTTTVPNALLYSGTASDGQIITIYFDQYEKWSIYPNNKFIIQNQ
ncbi:hypothetical protein HDF18_08455 [Mucilaginibacter sp. X5P1]|uniref:hypothetical protein n=1 Tax=Mucilaginibacter sp. X5P1 TaxID=2723088 RepID=UPI00161BBCE2|nr:hypothetical protein [Mucilaginibacter sp. X5P1]MBB6137688.1 hypothetical protein [Mucilaginibacter sp. X5P1]